MPVKILVYEDNALLRESLTQMLDANDDIQLLGAFENPSEINHHIEELKPDLLLMDIDMPVMTGIEALKLIRTRGHSAPVIMLTVFDDNPTVLEAIKAGASGYILKREINARIFAAIKEAMNGGAPMSPTVARMVIESMHQKAHTNIYDLTPREKEILNSLSIGNSYKMIAAHFEISIDTVRTHIKHIYDKLQVHSQTEAVSKAINEKLV